MVPDAKKISIRYRLARTLRQLLERDPAIRTFGAAPACRDAGPAGSVLQAGAAATLRIRPCG